MKKKLDKLPEERIKKSFNKTKKKLIQDGYSSEINKKLTKLIGYETWRKSKKGKQILKEYLSRDEVKEKKRKYMQREDVKKKLNKIRRDFNLTDEGQKRTKEKNLKQKAKPDFRKKANDYVRKRTKEDPVFKIRARLSSYILKSLKKQKAIKNQKFDKLLGCTVKDLKIYLEKKFRPGMTWKNHGLYGWHIDHIKPVSKFDLLDLEEQRRAFHYTNLQPLWALDNIRKSNKY